MQNKSIISVALAVLVITISMSVVSADESENISLIGYHHLQGRQALQVTTKSDPANGDWLYVGHVPNTRTEDATANPLTGISGRISEFRGQTTFFCCFGG